jgi:hypothetical protein
MYNNPRNITSRCVCPSRSLLNAGTTHHNHHSPTVIHDPADSRSCPLPSMEEIRSLAECAGSGEKVRLLKSLFAKLKEDKTFRREFAASTSRPRQRSAVKSSDPSPADDRDRPGTDVLARLISKTPLTPGSWDDPVQLELETAALAARCLACLAAEPRIHARVLGSTGNGRLFFEMLLPARHRATLEQISVRNVGSDASIVDALALVGQPRGGGDRWPAVRLSEAELELQERAITALQWLGARTESIEAFAREISQSFPEHSEAIPNFASPVCGLLFSFLYAESRQRTRRLGLRLVVNICTAVSAAVTSVRSSRYSNSGGNQWSTCRLGSSLLNHGVTNALLSVAEETSGGSADAVDNARVARVALESLAGALSVEGVQSSSPLMSGASSRAHRENPFPRNDDEALRILKRSAVHGNAAMAVHGHPLVPFINSTAQRTWELGAARLEIELRAGVALRVRQSSGSHGTILHYAIATDSIDLILLLFAQPEWDFLVIARDDTGRRPLDLVSPRLEFARDLLRWTRSTRARCFLWCVSQIKERRGTAVGSADGVDAGDLPMEVVGEIVRWCRAPRHRGREGRYGFRDLFAL